MRDVRGESPRDSTSYANSAERLQGVDRPCLCIEVRILGSSLPVSP